MYTQLNSNKPCDRTHTHKKPINYIEKKVASELFLKKVLLLY
jgi:hypothetical protein